ncbi:MAG: PASTA domain-containing protein [Ferruginibacter sp.]|nr:PASTA domain-containing protein [Cytophagales bacterium]
MITIKTNSRKDLLIHVGIVLSGVAILFLGFFFLYLPATTNHGETITVPNLAGMSVEELGDFLTSRDLRYEVDDSNFVINVKPNTVLTQYPKAGAKVKEGRKIYLTVTMRNAPMVEMPKLVDLSLRSAQATLKSYGLQPGRVKYVPDLAKDAVLGQEYRNKAVKKGEKVPKGAKIDLVVGDGQGNTEFEVPDVVGMSLEDAEVYLKGVRLRSSILYDPQSSEPPGTVIRQSPSSREGNKIRIGELIDLTVAGSQPTPQNETSNEDDK